MDLESRKRRIRKLVFASSSLSRALAAGEFSSSFKGRGMDFDGLREYGTDDDALRMDWNATARLGRPYVKTYRDDRNLSVYIVMDESASMDYGEGGGRRETAAAAASLVAYACGLNGVRVGGLFFGGEGLQHVEPDSGRGAVGAFMERIMEGRMGQGTGSDLAGALATTTAHLKRRSLVFVFSDFRISGYALALSLLARKHDAAAVLVRDGQGSHRTSTGFAIRAIDAESGRPRLVMRRSAAYREAVERNEKAARLEWLASVAAARVPYLELGPETDPVKALVEFFGRRRRAS
ncbi:MAG: DUF58 domain-containing protein [Spirochaetales bacterium]|nr:MAG: DUF58 domain-containing protein [Spirochaetales bacterium]